MVCLTSSKSIYEIYEEFLASQENRGYKDDKPQLDDDRTYYCSL